MVRTKNLSPSELCNQKIVDEAFSPIKEKLNLQKEEVEEIELLFKNCWYNFNSLIYRIKEIEGEIKLNPKIRETISKYKKNIPKEIVKLSNITIWEDTIIFEFHAFLTNIIRTINFLIKFNLKNKGNLNQDKYPTIGQFLHENQKNKYREIYYYSEFKKEYDEWIMDLKEDRDNITHKWVKKKMQGNLSVTWDEDNSGKINLINHITAGILDHNVENFEEYCENKLYRLKNLIENYFKKL